MANIINRTEISFRIDNKLHKIYKPEHNQDFWDGVQEQYQFGKTYEMSYDPKKRMVTLSNKPKKVIELDKIRNKA